MADLLVPAGELAAKNSASYPNESAAYRAARNALLVEEIELRRHIERVGAQRRALPVGGVVARDYEFASETGAGTELRTTPVRLTDLFGDKQTLMVYSMMFGPERKGPCPVCTSFLSSWNGTAANLRDRVAIAVTARSPIERLAEYKRERGFGSLQFYSDATGEYTRTYVSAEDADVPGFSVFTKRDGLVSHFYSGEKNGEMADPGQDPRGTPDADPLWLMLNLTPEGRGVDWYPRLKECC